MTVPESETGMSRGGGNSGCVADGSGYTHGRASSGAGPGLYFSGFGVGLLGGGRGNSTGTEGAGSNISGREDRRAEGYVAEYRTSAVRYSTEASCAWLGGPAALGPTRT